ncbi:MAG: hypothetical protein LBQ60_02690 [Bacteroidales bacterium]|jgi:hypothetical protein|nr:hypothetical protein [Bacteroidales bacterium]
MNTFRKLTLVVAGIILGLLPAFSQDDDESIVDLLTREVEVENPVYMPVIGIGLGYFNFFGDVNDAYRSLTIGKPGIRVNVATYLGKKHRFKGNLVFLTGDITGSQRTVPQGLVNGNWNLSDTSKNLNFKSSIFSFGFNLHYSFKPLIKGKYIEPFVSLGIETLGFNSKADYFDKNGHRYHYWSDGTIRIEAEDVNPNALETQRDYKYETDLRKANRSGLGKYSNFTLSIPMDVGFDINISERVTLRTATSFHYTFTDLFDDMTHASENDNYKGKKGNDKYMFSYVSLHFDLFSSDKVEIVEDLYADLDDFDMALYDDQDSDGVFDGWDECPDTPPGIPVDSVGCPFDTDTDGIPDYLDREVSKPGAIVDEYGVEINENMIVELLGKPALARKDVEAYLIAKRSQESSRVRESLPVPDKFKEVDQNNDGYISFDELLKAIDAYFDGTSEYSPEDIKELNEFFFEQ